jgi:hypothetical protein
MKENVFLYAFELAFKNELVLDKNEKGQYTDPFTISCFRHYVDSLGEALAKRKATEQS